MPAWLAQAEVTIPFACWFCVYVEEVGGKIQKKDRVPDEEVQEIESIGRAEVILK